MRKGIMVFIIRCALNALGLWVSLRLLGTDYRGESPNSVVWFLSAGLIFSVLNAVLKPILAVLSFPLIMLTLGLFTIVLNGLMVYLSIMLMPGDVHVTFINAIVSGIILSLVNYIISTSYDVAFIDKLEHKV